jgi:Flp pilus assembly protein protease CpaA
MDILFGAVNMPLEPLRIAVALVGTAVCAYYDLFNNKNIPERVLQVFLAAAVLVALIAYDPVATPYGLATGAILFIANYLLYKMGYLGGADVPILTAIAVLLPAQPAMFLLDKAANWLSFPFIIQVLTAAFITFMLHLLVKTVPHAVKLLGKSGSIQWSQWFGAFAILVSYAFLSVMMASMPILSGSYVLFLALLAGVSVYFVLFKQAINDSMIEWKAPKQVEVEDIIEPAKMDSSDVQKYSIGRLVDEAQLKRLQHVKGKIPVYSGLLPFVPHILIGLVLSLLFGNILFAISGMGMPTPYY